MPGETVAADAYRALRHCALSSKHQLVLWSKLGCRCFQAMKAMNWARGDCTEVMPSSRPTSARDTPAAWLEGEQANRDHVGDRGLEGRFSSDFCYLPRDDTSGVDDALHDDASSVVSFRSSLGCVPVQGIP